MFGQNSVRVKADSHGLHFTQVDEADSCCRKLDNFLYLCENTTFAAAVWPDKNRQMSVKVAQKWFHMENEWLWHLSKIA